MAYDTTKLVKLAALKALAEKVQSDYATKTSVSNLESRINDIVATGGEPNTINKISVNGVEQNIGEDKGVNITVPTKVGDLTNDQKFQTETEVGTAIQAAIAASGHAHFEKADAVPEAEAAQENVLYLVMNKKTKHYDIYAKVDEEVVLLDDTTVDLTAYATNESVEAKDAAMNTRMEAVEGKAHEHENKDVLDGITAVKVSKWDNAVSKSDFEADMYQVRDELEQETQRAERVESDIKDSVNTLSGKVGEPTAGKTVVGMISDAETAAKQYTDDQFTAKIASDTEVSEMLNEVFTTAE